MLVAEAVVLLVMGVGLLFVGRYGVLLAKDQETAGGLPSAELARRHWVLRGGVYACLVGGGLLVSLAVILLVASVVLMKYGAAPVAPATAGLA